MHARTHRPLLEGVLNGGDKDNGRGVRRAIRKGGVLSLCMAAVV